MNSPTARRPVRLRRGGPAGPRPRSDEAGFLSLEWVLTLPAMAILAALVLAAGFLVRDVLVLHEAARVGARAASTSTDDRAVTAAVHDAAPELADGRLTVRISPQVRRSGQQVAVEVAAERRYGPLRHQLSARSSAQVEPVVDPDPAGPPGPLLPAEQPAPGPPGSTPASNGWP